MARLRSKGVQGQSANTTGAQLRARGGELIAGGIASAFGAVGGAVQNKKAREAAQAEAEKSRRNALLIEGERSRQKQLDRESREKIAKGRATAAEQKAGEADLDKEKRRLLELHQFLGTLEQSGTPPDAPEVQKIRDDIKQSETSRASLEIKLDRTRARTRAEGIDPDSVTRTIEDVGEMSAALGRMEEDNKRAKERLDAGKSVDIHTGDEATAVRNRRRQLTDEISTRAGDIKRLKSRIEGAKSQSVQTLTQRIHTNRIGTSLNQLVEGAFNMGLDETEVLPLVQNLIERFKQDPMSVTEGQITRVNSVVTGLANQKRKDFEAAGERLDEEKEKAKQKGDIEAQIAGAKLPPSLQDRVRVVAKDNGFNSAMTELVQAQREWQDVLKTRGENILSVGGGGTSKAFKEESVPGAKPTDPDVKKRVLKKEMLPDMEHIAVDLAEGGIPENDRKMIVEAKWGKPTAQGQKIKIVNEILTHMDGRGYHESVLIKIRDYLNSLWNFM